MREIMSLVSRNMKKYFRDKGVLIFSGVPFSAKRRSM